MKNSEKANLYGGERNSPLTYLNEVLKVNLYHPTISSFKEMQKEKVDDSGHFPTGTCDHCGNVNVPVSPAKNYVSNNFTDWVGYTPSQINTFSTKKVQQVLWCGVCGSIFHNKVLKKVPILISVETIPATLVLGFTTVITRVNPDDLAVTDFLMKQLDENKKWSLSYPRWGNKHTAPHMKWGNVTTRSGTTPWGNQDSQLLQKTILLCKSLRLPYKDFTQTMMKQNLIQQVTANYTIFTKNSHLSSVELFGLLEKYPHKVLANHPQKELIVHLAHVASGQKVEGSDKNSEDTFAC